MTDEEHRCVVPTLQLGCLPGGRTVTRLAVRAVVRDDQGRLLLLRSTAGGDFKFPGGGVEPGEEPGVALARELDEECGRDLLGVGELLLRVLERRADRDAADAVFQMESRYYRAEVSPAQRGQRLEDYEAALGLAPTWVSPAAAIAANSEALAGADPAPWVARELRVLQWLAAADPSEAARRPG